MTEASGQPASDERKMFFEEFDFDSQHLKERAKELWHEGNIRRLQIRNKDGEKLLDIPLNAGIVCLLLAPRLIALGILARLFTKIKMEITPADDLG